MSIIYISHANNYPETLVIKKGSHRKGENIIFYTFKVRPHIFQILTLYLIF